MNIAVIGGAGAMGGIFGGALAQGGNDVTLVDVAPEAVQAINAEGLQIEEPSGATQTVRVRAISDLRDAQPVDLALVLVKCYHTESAIRSAAPLLGPATTVLSLQNGWGNAPRIASLIGEERLLVGVTYHSGTLLGPGRVLHAGSGATYIGELNGRISDRLQRVAETLSAAGLAATPSDDILKAIWSKLALNICTLPTSALLRFTSGQLVEHEGTLALMRGLLREAVAVAQAQGIGLDEHERWEAITGLLRRASSGKSSMLQDVERRRRTEIDVINGAIVEAGRRLDLPTPYNDSMVWLVKALESTF
jgi:2-dehydropantoate 2-reductase